MPRSPLRPSIGRNAQQLVRAAVDAPHPSTYRRRSNESHEAKTDRYGQIPCQQAIQQMDWHVRVKEEDQEDGLHRAHFQTWQGNSCMDFDAVGKKHTDTEQRSRSRKLLTLAPHDRKPICVDANSDSRTKLYHPRRCCAAPLQQVGIMTHMINKIPKLCEAGKPGPVWILVAWDVWGLQASVVSIQGLSSTDAAPEVVRRLPIGLPQSAHPAAAHAVLCMHRARGHAMGAPDRQPRCQASAKKARCRNKAPKMSHVARVATGSRYSEAHWDGITLAP